MATREIVLVTPSLTGGGAERCLLAITQGLQGSGYSATLVSLWADVDYAVCDANVCFARSHVIDKRAPYQSLLAPLPRVLTMVLDRADVICSNQWAADIVVGRYLHDRRRSGSEKSWTVGVQTDVVSDIGAGFKGGTRLRALRRYKDHVSKIVACSPNMRHQAKQYLQPTDRTEVVVGPNPASTDVPLRAWGKREVPRLVTAGRFVPQKGYDLALEVAQHLRADGVRARWDIYGEGPLRAKLQGEIEKADLSSMVRLRPFDSALHRRLGSYDLCVSTSAWEPFGNVMAEALMCGTPVVTTGTDGGTYIQSLIPEAVRVGRSATQLAKRIVEAPWAEVPPCSVAAKARELFSPDRVAELWL